jgi:hypothetical protein
MAWERAIAIDPYRFDCLFYIALAQAKSNADVRTVEHPTKRLLGNIADRTLRADILATLGDVYFEAGKIEIARCHYEASKQAFELPKDINFRARRGLLGT